MNNFSFQIPAVEIDIPTFTAALVSHGVNATHKFKVKQETETLNFTVPVGPHKSKWNFLFDLKDQTVTCSGKATHTFFGHEGWILTNEATQLDTLMEIISEGLLPIDGITLKRKHPNNFKIEGIELTNQFDLPKEFTTSTALDNIEGLFKTLRPRQYFPPTGGLRGSADEVRLGRTESSAVCRAYDPIGKFQSKPTHVSSEPWTALKNFCTGQLCIASWFNKRELTKAVMTTLPDWADNEKFAALVSKRYQELGLSVEFKATNSHVGPAAVRAINPLFFNYARHWFTAGNQGTPPKQHSGDFKRFKQFMATKGYCTDMPYAQHKHLVHGLHDVLIPERSAELPDELFYDQTLFNQWWLTDHQQPKLNFIK